jgi:hypothetical protein
MCAGAGCQPKNATAPPARLDAVDGRLGRSAALGDFYATLSEEQKARFEAIGQKRTG